MAGCLLLRVLYNNAHFGLYCHDSNVIAPFILIYLTGMRLSRFYATKNKIAQYWVFCTIPTYVTYAIDRGKKVTTTTQCTQLTRFASTIVANIFNVKLASTWFPLRLEHQSKIDEQAGTCKVGHLPSIDWDYHYTNGFRFSLDMSWIGSKTFCVSRQSYLTYVRYATLDLDKVGQGKLASCPTNFNRSKIFLMTSFIEALQLGLVAKKQGFPKQCPTLANS